MQLEKNDLISYAIGYEVSSSRCAMAEKFCELSNSKQIRIINDIFLDADDQ